MDTENQRREGVVAMEKELARVPGTYEHGALEEIDANNQLDRERPLASSYRRRKRRPEWELKYEKQSATRRVNAGLIGFGIARRFCTQSSIHGRSRSMSNLDGSYTLWKTTQALMGRPNSSHGRAELNTQELQSSTGLLYLLISIK